MKQTIKIPEKKIDQYRTELEEYTLNMMAGLSVTLKHIRKKNKWSSKDMSKVMGVGINMVTQYERGETYISLPSLIWYCEMSGQDPTTLLGYQTRTQRGCDPISASTLEVSLGPTI